MLSSRIKRVITIFGVVLCLPASVVLAQQHRTLVGNLHPDARPESDRGVVEPSMKLSYMTLALKRSPGQQAALDELLSVQQDLSSPLYHHWLTPEEFADRFGASQASIDKLVAWLQSSGFTVKQVARGRDFIVFSDAAAQVESGFKTAIHRYEVRGQIHYANTSAPAVPAELADLVEGIRGLDDLRLKPHMRQSPWPAVKIAGAVPGPDWYSKAFPDLNTIAPYDLAMIYGIGKLWDLGIDGTGQTIVVAGQSDIALSDIETFRDSFGLPFNDPWEMLIPGSDDPGSNGAMGEADLDLEWSGAVAPNATILYVYGTDVVAAAFYAIDQALAPVLSFSFGECELRTPPSDYRILANEAQKSAVEGITWLASSGDSGAAGCEDQNGPYTTSITRANVSQPASLPWVTAVGGSEFSEGNGSYWAPGSNSYYGSAMSYIPEGAWTDEGYIAQNPGSGAFASSGGGASMYASKPSWQKGAGVPNDGARDVPDVAMTASWFHDPYALITGGNFVPNGGTSAAAPSFAGIVSLLNGYLVSTGAQSWSGLGNINPMLYSLAQNAPGAFHDVKTGNNIVPCVINSTQDCTTGYFGYTAGPGYDQVTGLGSVDAYRLAQAWAATLRGGL
jgi:subtilase family serine protease